MFSEKLKQGCKVIQVTLIAVALMLGLAVPTQPAHAAASYTHCNLIQSMHCYADLFPGDQFIIESHTGISANLYVVNPSTREKPALVEFQYDGNYSEIELLPFGSVTFDIPRKEKPFLPTDGIVKNKTEDVIVRLSLVRNI